MEIMADMNITQDKNPIPAGFKLTEIGVIPEDWTYDSLERVCPPGKKYGIVDGPFGSNLKTKHYKKSGIPIISSGFVTTGQFLADEYIFVDEEKFRQEKRSAVAPGDIVMAKIGARCGASAILPIKHEIGILSGNALKITVNENKHETYFIWQFLWDLYSKGKFEDITAVGAQPAISMPHLKKLLIPLPTKSEQTAIANVLSDTDALITELEQLITKKEAIRTAIMQQLLTGRTRLPQFSKNPDGTIKGYKSSELGHIPEDWEVVKLKDVCFFENGDRSSNYPTPDSFVESGIPFINAGHIGEGIINQRGMNFITYKAFEKLGGGKVKPNDILFCLRGSLGKFGIVPDNFGIGAIASSLVIIRTKQQVLLLDYFASGYLKSSICENMIELWAGGAAQPNLGARELGNFLLPLPSVSEQRSIATILSDMDAELTTLKRKLAKIRDIKQGMMQQLLTGRIRLPLEQQP